MTGWLQGVLGVAICAVLGTAFVIVYRHKPCDGHGCGSCGGSCDKSEGTAPAGGKGDRR